MLGFIYHTSEYGWLVLLIVGLLFLGKHALVAVVLVIELIIFGLNALIYATKGKWNYFKEHWDDDDDNFFKSLHV